MPSLATKGYGCSLKRGDSGSPETFSKVTEVISWSGPAHAADQLDATNQDSPDGYREMIPGLKALRPISFSAHFLPAEATHALVRGDFDSQSVVNYQFVFSNLAATKVTVPCRVSELEPDAPIDGILTWRVTLTPSGKPTWS